MRIAIVGGGASGLTAAIAAARNGSEVTVFERNDKIGKKILVTGNGKCNISNMSLSEEFYYSDDRDFVVSAFERFGLEDTMRFFKGLGLLLVEKRGGIYPYSEQASAVLDALRFEAEAVGVKFVTNSFVTGVQKNLNCDYFEVLYDTSIISTGLDDKKANGKKTKPIVTGIQRNHQSFDKVILSTGGKAASKTGSDGNGYKLAKKLGHSISELSPALIGLKCKGDFWKSISGVRCSAGVSVSVDGKISGYDCGELQLVDYGISGIPVFQISRIASHALAEGKSVTATIDFLPEMSEKEFVEECCMRLLVMNERTNEQFFNGIFNKKLVQLFLKQCCLRTDDIVDKNSILKLAKLVKSFKVTIVEDNGFEQAQVTAGGVSLSDITESFESKICKGLYLIGELLDVDGKCGGYNLQWAWTSGYIAGEAAALC